MTSTRDSGSQPAGASSLQGERVRFRALQETDLPQLTRWWDNPEMAVFQNYTVTPRPDEALADMFRSWSKNTSGGGVGFSVVDRETDALVGHVVLYDASLPARGATLAVMIGAEHVDQGYGTDAVRLLTDFGFREMGLHRIELRVFAFNTRGRAVYSTLGYREEGVRREVVLHGGRFEDEVIMSLLAHEWFAAES